MMYAIFTLFIFVLCVLGYVLYGLSKQICETVSFLSKLEKKDV